MKHEDEEALVPREITDNLGDDGGADGDGTGETSARTSSSATAVDPDVEDEADCAERSFVSDHEEADADFERIEHVEPDEHHEIVEAKTATVVSMRRYGSTDLLGLVDGSQNEGQ